MLEIKHDESVAKENGKKPNESDAKIALNNELSLFSILFILSFVFYDFILRIFEVPNAQKKWYLSKSEFTELFKHYLFPLSSV